MGESLAFREGRKIVRSSDELSPVNGDGGALTRWTLAPPQGDLREQISLNTGFRDGLFSVKERLRVRGEARRAFFARAIELRWRSMLIRSKLASRRCGGCKGEGKAVAKTVVGVVLECEEYSVLSAGVGEVTNESVSVSGLGGRISVTRRCRDGLYGEAWKRRECGGGTGTRGGGIGKARGESGAKSADGKNLALPGTRRWSGSLKAEIPEGGQAS